MSPRLEFVVLATQSGIAFSELCRRFGVSRKTGYKWLERYRVGGTEALSDRSRRPHRSPKQVAPSVAQTVIALHVETTWGGRKLRRRLQDLGMPTVPAASTCTEILRRADLLKQDRPHGPVQRFERASPNELWQLDHKGHFPTQSGRRCHPLTALDDHSRYNLVLDPAANERTPTVQAALAHAFERYGLPEAILCDNGGAWGNTAAGTGHTPASRYRPSVRAMPATLPALEYPDMQVRTVRTKDVISFANQTWAIGEAFANGRPTSASSNSASSTSPSLRQPNTPCADSPACALPTINPCHRSHSKCHLSLRTLVTLVFVPYRDNRPYRPSITRTVGENRALPQ